MITGTVNVELEPTIGVRVFGPFGTEQHVAAIVDTGFNGFLTLPPPIIASLGLVQIGHGRALLADGSEELFALYEATVLWDGDMRQVETDAANTEPLVGMSMLEGCELRIQVVEDGSIRIAALP